MRDFFSRNRVLTGLTGLLLIPGWYEWGTGLTMLFAFIPLLIVMERLVALKSGGRKLFGLSFAGFLFWNFGATWWINFASFFGLLTAVFVSSLFMATAVWLAFKAWQMWGRRIGLIAFIVFWLAFEFCYTHGEISWPWLTLGNGFAYNHRLIQWYEFTGVFGGSLWVLASNVLIFRTFFPVSGHAQLHRKNAILASALIVLPVLVSLAIYFTYKEEINPRKIVVVQPNIDPYLKFNDIPPLEQSKIQVDEAERLVDSTVDYVVAPETSIMNNIWLHQMEQVPDIQMVRKFQQQYPQLKYITGIMCYQLYAPGEKLTATAREYGNGHYYDSYNSAIQIDSSDSIQIYHKSKLVIGVEKMPYPGLLKILKPLTLRLGGTFRSHNTQKERSVFTASGDSAKIGTIICYESVYGEFVTEYVKKGAGLLFVMTNDGWWRNTPGHRQHNSLSAIRAIETRRGIARSANTGISSFFNQRGDMLQKLTWWKRGALIDELNYNSRLTFYARHGDYIGRAAFYLGWALLATVLIKAFLKRIKRGR
ncbi:MAG: apolipoprotein N-acyltransferase [Bacteroidales bacterium]|nr:apolipoprotein N-acyltransferase [Bacteroidales bacterium]